MEKYLQKFQEKSLHEFLYKLVKKMSCRKTRNNFWKNTSRNYWRNPRKSCGEMSGKILMKISEVVLIEIPRNIPQDSPEGIPAGILPWIPERFQTEILRKFPQKIWWIESLDRKKKPWRNTKVIQGRKRFNIWRQIVIKSRKLFCMRRFSVQEYENQWKNPCL